MGLDLLTRPFCRCFFTIQFFVVVLEKRDDAFHTMFFLLFVSYLLFCLSPKSFVNIKAQMRCKRLQEFYTQHTTAESRSHDRFFIVSLCRFGCFGLDQAVLRLQLIKNIMNVDIVNLMIIYLDIHS